MAKEQLFLEQIEEHQRKVRVLEEYVELLEKKVSVLSSSTSEVMTKEAADMADSHLGLYQMMTGMTISSGESGPHKFRCTVKNPERRQLTRFFIETFPLDNNKISFAPEANPGFLPEYLRSGVTFDRQLAPLMLGDILQNLFGESTDATNM